MLRVEMSDVYRPHADVQSMAEMLVEATGVGKVDVDVQGWGEKTMQR